MFQAGLLLVIRRINSVETAVGVVMHYFDWLLAGLEWMTIPVAVYTELILLMMSS
jgi:uncharacterized membrane protein YhhN